MPVDLTHPRADIPMDWPHFWAYWWTYCCECPNGDWSLERRARLALKAEAACERLLADRNIKPSGRALRIDLTCQRITLAPEPSSQSTSYAVEGKDVNGRWTLIGISNGEKQLNPAKTTQDLQNLLSDIRTARQAANGPVCNELRVLKTTITTVIEPC